MEILEEDAEFEDGLNDVTLDVGTKASIDICGSASKDEDRRMECDVAPEVVKPCGRINSCLAIGKDILYLYGGMMEHKDREITLDDLYTLNLNKLDEWRCIIPASESEWVEASEDEDDDDDEEDDDDDGSGASNSEESDAEDDDVEDQKDDAGPVKFGDAVALIRGEGKTLRRKEKRARIEQIRASLGLSDSIRTPMPGETLRDFYKRTNTYWQMAAYEHTEHTGKELRKDGFDLAEARYKELKPILDELAKLEEEQKAEEQEVAESSSRKGGNKKSRASKR
ncbi:Kelch domain-containing protein [Drosera capensis]